MTGKIDKFIESLSPKVKGKLKGRLSEIRKNPREATNIKKLQGKKNLYRLRLGKIRVIFEIKEGIEIVDIDYRGNVY